MYLALLMAFFGIEAEVADYQDAQERILERVALDMISDIVQPANFIYEHTNDDNDLMITGSLFGDYDPDDLTAELVFENIENISANKLSALLSHNESQSTGIGIAYESSIVNKEAFFGKSVNDMLEVQLAFETTPEFSDSTRNDLIDALGRPKLADKIINRIKEQGVIRDTIDLAMTLVPRADALPFNLIVPSLFSAIRGSRGEIPINLRGVKRASSYAIDINNETRNRFGIRINKRSQKAILNLSKVETGNITVTARRLIDDSEAREVIKVRAIDPVWKYEDENDSKAFVNCPIEFDGTLRYVDRPEDINRYSLRISSDAGVTPPPQSLIEGHSWQGESFSGSGQIRIQLLIDGNEIPGMVHTIDVDVPGNPIMIVDKLPSGRRKIRIESFGCGNTIENVVVLGGLKTTTFTRESEDLRSMGEIEEWEGDLATDEMRVDIELMVLTKDGRQTRIKKTVLGNSMQGLSKRNQAARR